jgi:AmmeMemoRadiSam system protein A
VGKKRDVGVDLGLTDEEKEELLRIAGTVIDKCSRGEKIPTFQPKTEKLKEERGAFVCIYKRGMLRGCIGSLVADEPLYENVAHMALAASCQDPRFSPVREDEVSDLNLEISVLTPLVEIQDPEDIEVGRDGIFIRQGYRSGLLLPQVATDRNWDRITFLEETCRKAGLHRDAWKEEGTQIYVFSADVF